jgi:hypothetical protein
MVEKNNRSPEQNQPPVNRNIEAWFADLEKRILKEKENKEKKAKELRKLLTSKELKTLIEWIKSEEARKKLKMALDKIWRDFDQIWDDPEKLAELAKLITEIKDKNIESTQEKLSDFHKSIDNYSPSQKNYLSSKLFWDKLLNRAENPQNILDQALWLIIWIIDSIAVIWNFSKDLIKWIITLPKDIYDEIASKNTKKNQKNDNKNKK